MSFRNQQPSSENIEALDLSIIWKTSYASLRELKKIPAWDEFTQKINNEVQSFSEKLMLEIRTMTAEERYLLLIKSYPPDLLRKIPLKHLAGFLGIAPQSMSRIRKKFVSGHIN